MWSTEERGCMEPSCWNICPPKFDHLDSGSRLPPKLALLPINITITEPADEFCELGTESSASPNGSNNDDV